MTRSNAFKLLKRMKHIIVCSSKIEGLGVHAGENIKKEAVITKFQGQLKYKINKNERDALAHPDWVGVRKDYWIDPESPHKYFNHSCAPNASINKTVEIIALRDVRKGEEITFDYSITEGDPRWEMACNCGWTNCRKIVRSVQFLPEHLFEKYFPYMRIYFKKLYTKANKKHGTVRA
ncbi:MAG TPA: SET domain-containing protein [Candidatus Brocadiaceae bacterium]